MKLPDIIYKIEKKTEEILNKDVSYFVQENTGGEDIRKNRIYKGDNINCIVDLIKTGYGESFDLIYIDPPFFSNAKYTNRVDIDLGKKCSFNLFAYDDNWKGGLVEYLEDIGLRINLIRILLSKRGSLYVHLDYRAVHYIKIILDCIFGEENFINEIIWAYKSGGSSKRSFAKKHDTILMYSKSKEYIYNPQFEKSYNRGLKPYGFKGVEEFKDEVGWYTMVKMKDIWNIDMVGRTSKERVGYRTQKPEKLIERIIMTSSNEGSLIGDFYGGSGTTAVVAGKLKRRWIISDKGNISIGLIKKRISKEENIGYDLLREDKLPIEDYLQTKIIKNQEGKYSIEIINYNAEYGDLKLDKKSKALFEEVKKRGLIFIDYIGIVEVDKKKNTTKIILESYRDNEIKNILEVENIENKYLQVGDIFGREFLQKL